MASQENIKDIIKQEYTKCMLDPVHFMKKYCLIQHPTRGRLPFNLYPFQDKVLNIFQKYNYSIVLKSRQLGISTLVAGYSLWLMIFQQDKNILCIATKQDTAKNMITKVRFMYENLPSWLRGNKKPLENNKLLLKLVNGSQIKAVSAASDAGRSEAVSLLIIDEAAFISDIDTIFGSAHQTLATGGGCIVLSTPNGTGNWFHKTWVKSENGEGSFVPIKLRWDLHPERDQKWRDEQDEDLGERIAAQECDCDFNTSGNTVFESAILEWYGKNTMEPVEKRGVDGNLWIWEQPNYTKSYLVIADVARGDGEDYSAAHVIDIETVTQVAEYRGQIGTRDFGHLLVGLASEYNDALLSIENNSIGWDTVQTAIDRGYRNLYYSPKTDAYTSDQWAKRNENIDSLVAGFSTTIKTRPLMIEKFREYTKERACIIRSNRLVEEMRVFIWKNSKAQAQRGYNDDLVMSFSMGLYLRDTALRFRKINIESDRANLSSIIVDKGQVPGDYFRGNQQPNPWQMHTERGNEDISWLLK